MRLPILIFSLSLLGACIPKVEETKVKLVPRAQGGASAYPARWSAANLVSPLPVDISSDFDGEFTAADDDGDGDNPIVQAMKSWNDAHSTIDFFEVPASSVANKSSTDLTTYRDSVMGIYMSHTWFDGISSSTLAITQFYGYLRNSGSTDAFIDLTHADIIVNYRDHSFSTNPTGGQFDIQTVILHELGHFVGLKHPEDAYVNAVMQNSLSPAYAKRTLRPYDINSIVSNYNGYNPNLTHFQAASANRDYAEEEGEEISGYYELKSDGRCEHWVGGELVEVHHLKVD